MEQNFPVAQERPPVEQCSPVQPTGITQSKSPLQSQCSSRCSMKETTAHEEPTKE